jgi:hypothetical protein
MTTPVRGIAVLDRRAGELAAAAGVRLGVADSPAELIAAYRLRARETGTTPTVQSDPDAFDARALQICAWDGETLVGTLRLVLPVPGKRLPLEQEFGLAVEPAGEVVELCAPLVTPEWSGQPRRRVEDGLVAQAWFETRARDYRVMAAAVSPQLAARYGALGLGVEPLARLGDRSAVRLDPAARKGAPPGEAG